MSGVRGVRGICGVRGGEGRLRVRGFVTLKGGGIIDDAIVAVY